MASIGSKTGPELARGGLTSLSIKPTGIRASRVHPDVLDGSFLAYNGFGQPALFLADMTALASGADGVEHIAALPGAGHLHYWPNGNAGAEPGPSAEATGLRLSMSAAASEGAAYRMANESLVSAFTVAVRNLNKDAPPGMFIRARLALSDPTELTHCFVGFTEEGTAPDGGLAGTYDDMVGINVVLGPVTPENGEVDAYSNLGGAGAIIQDTGNLWLTDEIHEIEVQVNGNGTVKRLFDGRVVGPAYTFADLLSVSPLIQTLNEAGGAVNVDCVALTVGALDQAGGKR